QHGNERASHPSPSGGSRRFRSGSRSSRKTEQGARGEQQEKGIETSDQVVDHDTQASRERLALARRERLPDVEDTKEHERRYEHADRSREREDGEDHAGHFVDHDHARVLRAERSLDPSTGPDPEDRDANERGKKSRLAERDQPQRDERDEAADGPGDEGRA